jgi:hypothetical protein
MGFEDLDGATGGMNESSFDELANFESGDWIDEG